MIVKELFHSRIVTLYIPATILCALSSPFLTGCEGRRSARSAPEARAVTSVSGVGKQRLIPEYERKAGSLISHDMNVIDAELGILSALSDAGTVWGVGSKKRYDMESPGFPTIADLLADMTSRLPAASFAKVRTISGSSSDGAFAGLWMRDYGPGFARTTDGSNAVRVLRYQPWSQEGSVEVPKLFADAAGLQVVEVPVRIDGGNILINSDGVCLTTEGGTPARNPLEKDQSEAEVHRALRDFAGCTEVVALPRIPGEGTGHVDMFFKFLKNDVVAVGRMDDDAVARSGDPEEARAQQKALVVARKILSDKGFKIVDIPVPAIVYGQAHAMNRSYVNGVILNGTILVPRFERFYAIQHFDFEMPEGDDNPLWRDYPDEDRIPEFERLVKEGYESAGLKVRFVNADRIGAYYGALHCAIIGVPQF